MAMACLTEPPSVKSLPSNLKWVTGEDTGGTNRNVIVSHFTLLISANDRHCVDEWKRVPWVSDTSISMPNGCLWSMKNVLIISEARRSKHKPSNSVIYGLYRAKCPHCLWDDKLWQIPYVDTELKWDHQNPIYTFTFTYSYRSNWVQHSLKLSTA